MKHLLCRFFASASTPRFISNKRLKLRADPASKLFRCLELKRRIAPAQGYRPRADQSGKVELNWKYRLGGPENGVAQTPAARAPNDLDVGVLVDGWMIVKEHADLAPLFRAAGSKQESKQLVALVQLFPNLNSASCELSHTNIRLNGKLQPEMFSPERPLNATEVISFNFIP
jgi:hypothetical protein